jgi:RNA polymerase sigma-70 factor (ECF subfamily)
MAEIISEEALIRRVCEREDREALAKILERHGDFVFRFAMRLCDSREEAEDLTQDVWLSFIRSVKRFNYRQGTLTSWLGAIVINQYRMNKRELGRRKKRERTVGERQSAFAGTGEPAFVETSETKDQAALRRELAALPEKYRLVVSLRFLENLPAREVAASLGLKENTVHVQLRHGLSLLRKRLTARGFSAAPAALLATLSLLPPESSPVSAALQAKLTAIIQTQPLSAAATMSVSGAKFIGAWLWAAVAVLSVAGAFAWHAYVSSPPKNSTPVGRVCAGEYAWDFNAGAVAELQVLSGAWHWSAAGGTEDSGCMTVKTEMVSAPTDAQRHLLPTALTIILPHPPRPLPWILEFDAYAEDGEGWLIELTWTAGKINADDPALVSSFETKEGWRRERYLIRETRLENHSSKHERPVLARRQEIEAGANLALKFVGRGKAARLRFDNLSLRPALPEEMKQPVLFCLSQFDDPNSGKNILGAVWRPSGGVGDSSCLEFTNNHSEIVLRTPFRREDLPLKISWRILLKEEHRPNPDNNLWGINLFWQRSTRFRFIIEKNMPRTMDTGKWHTCVAYVTEEVLDLWIEGSRTLMRICEPLGDRQMDLLRQEVEGGMLFDDLTVEMISASALPPFPEEDQKRIVEYREEIGRRIRDAANRPAQ